MATPIDVKPESDKELVLARLIDAPRDKVFRAWTDPQLLAQWFAPRPWTVPNVKFDMHAGGSTTLTMRSPEGQEFTYPGLILEVVPNEKIVMTDAFTEAWVPSERHFMTTTITFENAGDGKTRYIARVRHPTVEMREEHEKMGFHEGWGICANQLEEVAQR